MRLLLLSLCACSLCHPSGLKDDTEADTDADADADTDTDTDADTGTTDTGAVFEPEDPSYVAGFSSETYEAQEGRWLVVGAETWLSGYRDNHAVSLEVVVTGDLSRRGTFNVRTVRYRSAIDEDSWNFQYQGNGGATFVVEGHDEDGELLWGHLEGSVPLTDLQGGPDMSLDSLVLVSWPQNL
ncbi:MAG: hypothetical protein ABIO70_23430 [Pseudomonadota bacterium]